MKIKRGWMAGLAMCWLGVFTFAGIGGPAFDRYHGPAELNAALEGWAAAHPELAKVHTLARTPLGNSLLLLEIGPEVASVKKTRPAVFVAANMEGNVPLAGEAALYLAQQLLEKAEARQELTWYILPAGNPDALAGFFAKPLRSDTRNGRPYNDDMDDQTGEDGPDDLNGDGIITMMRVKDPAGQWLAVPAEPRAMKRADTGKGERGEYKLYTEGIDNDGDGEYNEDGPGGVNPGVNFPHLFQFFKTDGGSWAGSEEECFQLMRFIYDHPEIGLTFTFGRSNFCLAAPRAGRTGQADLSKIKIPEDIGKRVGIDTSRTYTMEEIMEMMKRFVPPGMELTESMIASFLGLGAVVNPLPEDLKFYNELVEKYKEFLKKNELDGKRLEPAPDKDGSFELWSYYHLGLPSFALDFWTLPEVKEEKKEAAKGFNPDELEKMTNDEFIALGEEKIGEMMKASGTPAQLTAQMVIQGVKGGGMTTKRMAEMIRRMNKQKESGDVDAETKAWLAFSDKELGGKGFVNWQPFTHPVLGAVEIGGKVPFTDTTPPPAMIEKLLAGQVPWIFEITKKMARIKMEPLKVEDLGSGLYRLTAWIRNEGYLPYPVAMGLRNEQITPVIVTIEGTGLTILEGKARSLIKNVPGLEARKVTWLIRAGTPQTVKVKAETRNAWSDTAEIRVGGAQ